MPRKCNRLTAAKQQELQTWLTRALAQGRLKTFTDAEAARLAEAALGWHCTAGNIKGARLSLDIHKGKGSTTPHSSERFALSAVDRPVRVAAMNWLMFLDEAELLETSIHDCWASVQYDPSRGRLYLPTEHGELSSTVDVWAR